eukprot:357202-Chlamydomonas_euryale.AAC.5
MHCVVRCHKTNVVAWPGRFSNPNAACQARSFKAALAMEERVVDEWQRALGSRTGVKIRCVEPIVAFAAVALLIWLACSAVDGRQLATW